MRTQLLTGPVPGPLGQTHHLTHSQTPASLILNSGPMSYPGSSIGGGQEENSPADSLLEQLEFDLWEGQFEFLGNGQDGQQETSTGIDYRQREEDESANGPTRPRFILAGETNNNGHHQNGFRKRNRFREQAWCKDIANHVQMLQQQMNVLADNQNHSDERYTRARQENAALQARIHMLEEQLRETELRSEERLQDEERRHRELMNRVDREKQLQVENCTIRLHTLELENTTLKEEAVRCRTQADRLRADKEALEDRLEESKETINSLTEEIGSLQEQQRKEREQNSHNQQLIEEMSSEIDRLRKEQKACIEEISIRSNGVSNSDHQDLQAQLCQLRQENKRLEEAHDEMQALLLTRSVEEGRTLLTENKSLAAELEAMSQDEHGVNGQEEIEVRGALKEQQEVNLQLRAYIDGILLNIVENYPQLLEVKPNP